MRLKADSTVWAVSTRNSKRSRVRCNSVQMMASSSTRSIDFITHDTRELALSVDLGVVGIEAEIGEQEGLSARLCTSPLRFDRDEDRVDLRN